MFACFEERPSIFVDTSEVFGQRIRDSLGIPTQRNPEYIEDPYFDPLCNGLPIKRPLSILKGKLMQLCQVLFFLFCLLEKSYFTLLIFIEKLIILDVEISISPKSGII
ncbi:hypothetical protein ScPMuIL_018311 [Solemya velum]